MHEQQPTVPDELQSTYSMLRCAFPTGIPQDAYLPLLAVLGEQMSHRSVAATMVLFFGGKYVDHMNDVYKALSAQGPDAVTVQRVQELLIPCGYQAWLDEEAQ